MKEHEFNCPYCYNDISTWVETDKFKQQIIDTFKPLQLTEPALEFEKPGYSESWMEDKYK